MGKKTLGFKGIRPVMIAIAALTLIQSVSIIFMAIGLAESISALFGGSSLQEQSGTIAVFLFAFIIRHVTALVSQKLAYRYAERTGRDLRKELMDKLFQFGPRLAKTEGTGNLVTLVLDGVAQFRTYLELFIPRMLGTAITPVLIWVYILWLDRVAALILAVTMPILIVFMILMGLAAKKQMDRQWESYRVLSNHFVDSLRGLETLKMLGLSRSHSSSIEGVSDKYRTATMKTLRVAFLSSFALDFFTMLSVASVAVSLGLRLINGTMELEPALLVLILAPEYFLPVRMVGADYHATLKGKEAGKAIQTLIEAASTEAMTSALPAGLTWSADSVLKLSQLGVQHEEDGPHSLQDVTLELRGCKKVGIIGTSGAGKSTLIDVLGGFLRPTAGELEVDGIKVAALSDEAWRTAVTYIPQHPYIFSSSLADNVRFYHPEATDEAVSRALTAAGLAELVKGLPQGEAELIGNGGRRLSGGQEQRVALARAFLSDRPIMLLDEPTAHLDIETEYELKETMLPLFEGKLVLLATHRMHWMPDMDVIVVMDQGSIAEVGSHQELLNRKGKYYELMKAEGEELG
ncbi:thiol reductant ABC exporter subunit CydD [Paenibacillus sp. UMB4589-SE434]|uniref:thiol reductant ABC exporter subunit CydD n=1 Tax=Paenibacillus sp. UMB4589-SE434 TaxID=3046314 RepID=UPI00255012E0|nr:thiol reductant ABC exporter subunit CydD [Paenibacillus sp. UMB4589-SE434]MDK8181419.1 thiol reductant ABC exporter subunit CydD [Paenibacillus sp. UMB4589-SE434]